MVGFAVSDNAHLFLEKYHRAIFHPRFQFVRVGSFTFWRLLDSCHISEKGHLRVHSVLSATRKKAFPEVTAKVKFEQCGEILRHGVFIALPLVFAYILAVLVLYNAATRGKGGFRQGENFVGMFGHCACGVRFFPAYLQKQLFPL